MVHTTSATRTMEYTSGTCSGRGVQYVVLIQLPAQSQPASGGSKTSCGRPRRGNKVSCADVSGPANYGAPYHLLDVTNNRNSPCD